MVDADRASLASAKGGWTEHGLHVPASVSGIGLSELGGLLLAAGNCCYCLMLRSFENGSLSDLTCKDVVFVFKQKHIDAVRRLKDLQCCLRKRVELTVSLKRCRKHSQMFPYRSEG